MGGPEVDIFNIGLDAHDSFLNAATMVPSGPDNLGFLPVPPTDITPLTDDDRLAEWTSSVGSYFECGHGPE